MHEKLPEAALYTFDIQGNLVPLDQSLYLPKLVKVKYVNRICYVADGLPAIPENNFWAVTCIKDETLPPEDKKRFHKWRISNPKLSHARLTIGNKFDAMLKAYKPIQLPNNDANSFSLQNKEEVDE